MQTLRTLAAGSLIVLLAFASPVSAQERHVVDPSLLAQTVAGAATQQEADRAAVRATLAREEVRGMVAKAGLDIDVVTASVDTLDAATLAQAAASARPIDQSLVGGASVTFSTTTIIIALLIIIRIVVAVD